MEGVHGFVCALCLVRFALLCCPVVSYPFLPRGIFFWCTLMVHLLPVFNFCLFFVHVCQLWDLSRLSTVLIHLGLVLPLRQPGRVCLILMLCVLGAGIFLSGLQDGIGQALFRSSWWW
ncbi:hypothetical protein GDO81_014920 [Engystomops pustulosus]|uniref:Uncharacterized protein n=1 Tax=Engystomops pustulosus TaxID=76066 RepID=A0AAV7AFK2_ENGPU|nr:hypothetical protein GDO81_014920 [Engystomops pustulosus]